VRTKVQAAVGDDTTVDVQPDLHEDYSIEIVPAAIMRLMRG
jgi:hypothetical protein